MRIVPKPEGFDLRQKRAEKDSDPSAWTPADAIFDASGRIEGKHVTQLVVYWWEKDGEREILRWAHATTGIAEHGWLLHRAIDAMTHR